MHKYFLCSVVCLVLTVNYLRRLSFVLFLQNVVFSEYLKGAQV